MIPLEFFKILLEFLWSSLEFLGVPWSSVEVLGDPRGSSEFLGVLWSSSLGVL
jgi:hypothetical protein